MSRIRAVTFDAGQTLIELSTELLSQRLAERGVRLTARSLDAAAPAAWQGYASCLARGQTGEAAWKHFMSTLLGSADRAPSTPAAMGDSERATDAASITELCDWLWSEQPRRNLWRRPVPGMIDLARELGARDIPVAIISNSEGKLAELFAELGQADAFRVIADSGVLGFEKPGPEIFEWTAAKLGVDTKQLLHVGDSYEADVRGALGVGAAAVWFNPAGFSATAAAWTGPASCAVGGFEPVDAAPTSSHRAPISSRPSIRRACTAFELREHLVDLGLL